MRGQLRVGSLTCWVLAWALAVSGPLVYAFWPYDLGWWIAIAAIVPLGSLIAWRAERTDSRPDPSGSAADGALGPPDGGGGGGP